MGLTRPSAILLGFWRVYGTRYISQSGFQAWHFAVDMPPKFGERELLELRGLIDLALREDLPGGDATTDPLVGPTRDGTGPLAGMAARFVARESGVAAGVPVVKELFGRSTPAVEVVVRTPDGQPLSAGVTLAEVRGPAAEILRLERTVLNFLQRLSGIASGTAKWVEELGDSHAELVDTRKTTPGWRYLEKYAVRCGGASNHRFNLSDGVLVKDNHIAVLRELGRGDFPDWVATLRAAASELFLQVEVDTREQFISVLGLPIDAVLLDNFGVDDLKWAVERRNAQHASRPLLEASGGIQRSTLKAVAATGVDRISVGALTHSAPSLDIALDIIDAFEIRGGS